MHAGSASTLFELSVRREYPNGEKCVRRSVAFGRMEELSEKNVSMKERLTGIICFDIALMG